MDYTPQRAFKLVDEVSERVRLAEGVGDDGRLQAKPMRRAIESVKLFHTFCRTARVGSIIAVATSAVRDAANRAAFLDQVRREVGLDLRVLSGEEEAFYGYLGAVNSLPFANGCVVDIGGGSAQLTLVRDRTMEQTISAPAGVVRFSERYIHSDPISSSDYQALEAAADTVLDLAPWLAAAPGDTLAAIGGTARNIAHMHQKARAYPLDHAHSYAMSGDDLTGVVERLRKLSQREREQVPGLNRDRADVILSGAVLLQQVMRRGRFQQMLVGGAGLREGLFYEHFLSDQPRPLFEDIRAFSVQNLAYQYNYEPEHVAKVRELSLALFDQLSALHGYGASERELLGHAAIIHDIGVAVSYYDHHKHSAYLVLNSELQGFSHREKIILALLTRFHRKGEASLGPYGSILATDDGTRVARLSALLRIAEYLERSKGQVVQRLDVRVRAEGVLVEVVASGDASVEIWDANRRSGLFRKAFGIPI
ncbi:MAG: Ppx/GppA family phosphatase, partial [Chloroflexales bacterium]|nr:Ppx/GppA family phosphatase [Chloroflexales bacterium]